MKGVRARLESAHAIEQISMDLDQFLPVKKLDQSVNKHPTYTQVDASYQYHLDSNKFIDNPTSILISGLIAGYENACRALNGRTHSEPQLPFTNPNPEDTNIWPAVCYKPGSGEALFRFYIYATTGTNPLDKTLWSVFQYPNPTVTNQNLWLVDATENSIYHVQNTIKQVSPKLSSEVSMDARNLKIGYLNFNKTRFDSLPLSCFKITAKVHDDSVLENAPIDDPGRGSMTINETYGQTAIGVRSGIKAKCLGPKLGRVSLYFGNNRLVGASFDVDPGSSLLNDLQRTIPGLVFVNKTNNERLYQSKDYEVTHYKAPDIANPKIINETISIWSRIPEQQANQYLATYGYPNYYGLRLGQTSKADLKDLLQNAYQNNFDKKLNQYHVLVNLPIFGFNAFGDPRVYLRLKFNDEDRLYEFMIAPSQYSTRLPTKTAIENFMRNSFSFAMLTDSHIIEIPPKPAKLLSYHYFNNAYPLEKTGGIPLYAVQLLIRKGESRVEGLIFTNGLAIPPI